jgi:hypothetical protein
VVFHEAVAGGPGGTIIDDSITTFALEFNFIASGTNIVPTAADAAFTDISTEAELDAPKEFLTVTVTRTEILVTPEGIVNEFSGITRQSEVEINGLGQLPPNRGEISTHCHI